MKFSIHGLRYAACSAIVSGLSLSGLLLLGACAGAPPQVKALVSPTYDELMTSADEAQKKGGVVEAMGFYEKAAKADPAKKQPWARIAQAQFDARNYGAAITAAQEVIQRDTTDVTAKSILAVSGLRVSASALDQLRQANALGSSTRDEAQVLARIMRDALGESILPPAPPVAAASEPHRPPPVRPVRRPAAAPANAGSPAPAPAPAAAEPKRNPFDALKG